MDSASSTSAKNLFSDSRRRLCERAVASVHSLGSVSRQVARGSRQHDILTNSAKQLCQTESAMENSFNNLQRMQVLLAQIAHAQSSIEENLKKVDEVQEQINDMQR